MDQTVSTERFKYEFIMYNRFFSLRLNLAMKLILVFLCKDFFLMAVVGATAFKGKGSADVSQLMALVRPIFFLADFPAVAVAYAASARRPAPEHFRA